MLSILNTIPTFNNFAGFARGDGEISVDHMVKLTSIEHENADVTFFTEEGDKITLSSESQTTSSYMNYRGLLLKHNYSESIEMEKASLNSDNQFSMMVDGDLSGEELKDINKAIKIVDKIMQELKSGDIDNALRLADKAVSLGSISSLSASMEREKTATIEELVQVSFSSSPSGNINNHPETCNNEEKIKTLSDKLMDIISHSPINESKLTKSFNGYFSQLMEKSDTFKLTGSNLMDMVKDIYSRSLIE